MCCSAPLPCDTSDTGHLLALGCQEMSLSSTQLLGTFRALAGRGQRTQCGSAAGASRQCDWQGVEIIQVVLTRHFLFHELIH